MNWDNLIQQLAVCPTSTNPDGSGGDPRCSDPAFAEANPTICFPEETFLILRPEYSIKEPLHIVHYTTYAVIGGVEMDVSRDSTYFTASPSVATIDSVTGRATTVLPGITTISTLWNGLHAFAQLEVVEDCNTTPFTFVLLFDNSKSMGVEYGGAFATKLDCAKSAANRFIDQIDFTRDTVIVGSFNFTGTASFDTATSSSTAHAMVNTVQVTTQFTDIGDGITQAIAEVASVSAHKIVCLFSDGENKLGVNPVTVSDAFQRAGNIVISYGVRAYTGGLTLLRSIADGGFWSNSFPIAGVPNSGEDAFIAMLSNICRTCNPDDNSDTGDGYGYGCAPEPQVDDPNPTVDIEEYPPRWHSTQSYTATCPEGEAGGPLTRTASYTSFISQQDADDQALALAKADAEEFIICGAIPVDGSRWELPCKTVPTNHTGLCACVDPADVPTTIGGSVETIYNVTLRFRGVMELCGYSGGTNDGAFFQIGGTPDASGYNVYALVVADPPQTYYLNRYHTFIGDGSPYVFAIDYQATVPVRGSTVITLQARSRDGVELFSDAVVVTGIPAAPVGQFIQVDVISIT